MRNKKEKKKYKLLLKMNKISFKLFIFICNFVFIFGQYFGGPNYPGPIPRPNYPNQNYGGFNQACRQSQQPCDNGLVCYAYKCSCPTGFQ